MVQTTLLVLQPSTVQDLATAVVLVCRHVSGACECVCVCVYVCVCADMVLAISPCSALCQCHHSLVSEQQCL